LITICFVYTQTTAAYASVCYDSQQKPIPVGATVISPSGCQNCTCICTSFSSTATGERYCSSATFGNCVAITPTPGNCQTTTAPIYCQDTTTNTLRALGEVWRLDSCTVCSCNRDQLSTTTGKITCQPAPNCTSTVNPSLCYRRTSTGALDQGWQIGSSYVDGCSICSCRQPEPNIPAAFVCIQSYNLCPTTSQTTQAPRPTCNFGGVVYQIGDVLTKPCFRCVCSLISGTLDAVANFSCTPVDSTSTTNIAGTNCPNTTITRCYLGTQVFAVGQSFTDSTGCRNGTCLATGQISTVSNGLCSTLPPQNTGTCNLGTTTLQVGQEVTTGCQVCKCAIVCTADSNTVSSNAACSVQLSCYTTSTTANCLPSGSCVDTNNQIYKPGEIWYKSRCEACVCGPDGWRCNDITGSSICPTATPNQPVCTSLTGTTYQIGQIVFFDDCSKCVCQRSLSSSGVVGASFNCTKDPNRCPTNTPTGGTTQRFCYDKAGNAHLPGTAIPAVDGCGICTCSYDNPLAGSTAPTNGPISVSSPSWKCVPVASSTSTCCNVSGIIYRPGATNLISRSDCKVCNCTSTGLSCTAIPNCGTTVCTDQGRVYLNGEYRRDTTSNCGFCKCSAGSWQCSTETCVQKCIKLDITVTMSGPDAHVEQSTVVSVLNGLFGVNAWAFVSYDSSPDVLTFEFIVKCLDAQTSASAISAEIVLKLKANFSPPGSTSQPNVNSQVVDPGTSATSTTQSVSDSSKLFVGFFLVFLLISFVSLF